MDGQPPEAPRAAAGPPARRRLDLAAHLRRVQLLNPTQAAAGQGGFRCETCAASFTSYDAFLDHQNGKVHLRNAGVERAAVLKPASVGTVKARLEALKRAREAASQPQPSAEEALEARLQRAREDEAQAKRERYEHRKKKRRQQ